MRAHEIGFPRPPYGVRDLGVNAMTSESGVPLKTCVCRGVRWCASCLAPELRVAHGMHPPLSSRDRGIAGAEPLDFDLETQAVVGAPEFRGVRVLPDFCSSGEEKGLLRDVDRGRFAPAQSGKLKQHYGAKSNFKRRKLSLAGFVGLPGYVGWIEERLRSYLLREPPRDRRLLSHFLRYEASDAFVLRYTEAKASNLDLHVDDTFAYGEGIVGVSLESDSVLRFAEPTASRSPRRIVRVPLPARSAVLLWGAARFEWQHGIFADDIRGRRTSITLRCLSETLRDSGVGREIRAIARGTRNGSAAARPLSGSRRAGGSRVEFE